MFITLGNVVIPHPDLPEGNVAIPSKPVAWHPDDRPGSTGRVSRRGFLHQAAGAAFVGTAGVPLLVVACGQPPAQTSGATAGTAPRGNAGAGASTSSGASAARAALPTHVTFQGPKA